MPKRLITIYIEDEVLEVLDKLTKDVELVEMARDEEVKRTGKGAYTLFLSRSEVVELLVKRYWRERTKDGMLALV